MVEGNWFNEQEIAQVLAGTLTDPEEAKPKKNECPECVHSW